MKKLTVLAFLLSLAIGANAQSATARGARANATGKTTVNVPPVAKVPPVAINGQKKK
ncbi:MAG TPA: hypothetical protein VL240_06230 [Candidatus Binatia bacterium]|nr:hypothetical protein [Candidatus Binatia bacterium]